MATEKPYKFPKTMIPKAAIEEVISPLTVTVQSVSNTTAETTMISFTIPANTLADGQSISLEYLLKALNDTGGAAALTTKLYIDDGTNQQHIDGAASTAVVQDPVGVVNGYAVNFVRIGNALWSNAIYEYNIQRYYGPCDEGLDVDFTADIAVSITATLSVASASLGVTPLAAKVIQQA